jgi:3-hydroxyisobutyrate dehydrogenase-like beta-hydroxyacid dehydrogenase
VSEPLTVAILGLGEAGGRFAGDLAALGAEVRGCDPDPERGAGFAGSAAEAVRGSDVVLSLNSAAAALEAARSASAALSPGQLYADLNSAGPQTKRAIAAVVAPTGALFVDVALLAPVPRRGLRTPALASGPGAQGFEQRFGALGMPVEVVGDEAGAAATRKLVRSVFMKGLAAAIVESLDAAERAGCERWLEEEIAAVLDGPGAPLLERLRDGTRLHAARRAGEMQDARDLLLELGLEPRVTSATLALLEALATEQVPA